MAALSYDGHESKNPKKIVYFMIILHTHKNLFII